MQKFSLLLVLFFAATVVSAETISFDLDETLISSANMRHRDLKRARELGYEVKESSQGYNYVVRPESEKLLSKIKELGFDLIIITHNNKEYALDVLNSSGLIKYFDKVISNEDLKQKYNRDFVKYPYHRNHTQAQKSFVSRWTKGFYKGFIKRSGLFLLGNTNIRPYLPKKNINKYPPVYGSRFHVDNNKHNIERPLDFIGIEVDDFYAVDLEDKCLQEVYSTPSNACRYTGFDYQWTQNLLDSVYKLKEQGWVSSFKSIYGRDAVVSNVESVI